MNRIKSRGARLICATLLLLSGCSVGGNIETPGEASLLATERPSALHASGNGILEFGKAPLHITFFGHYSAYTMPEWGVDPSSRWIRDNKNVHVTGISSEGKSTWKLQKMIASDKLPDLIWGELNSDMLSLRDEGLLVPLDEYIEKFPNLRTWAGSQILELLRAPDGHIYFFPNYYSNEPYGNAGYVVNKRIYRELGSPKLETTDDLYDYLKRVQNSFPDVVPFETGIAKDGHGIDQLFSAFKENNFSFTRHFAVTTGDQMTSIYKDEGFRESAVYAAKLMLEGLMTPDAMTQTEDQVVEKLLQGRVAVFASADPIRYTMTPHARLVKNNPEDGYFFIEPIYKEGLDRSLIYPGTYNILGWNVSAITKDAAHPEAVFAMLDWMTGPEGSAVQMWGPPGPDGFWDGFKEDGITPRFTSRYVGDPEGLASIQALSPNLIWVGNTKYLDSVKSEYEMSLPEDKRSWAAYWQSKITWKTQGDATPFINLYPIPDSEEGEIYRKLKEIWRSARANAMFGTTDQEVLDILDKAHEDSIAVGFERYLAYITDKWKDNLHILEPK